MTRALQPGGWLARRCLYRVPGGHLPKRYQAGPVVERIAHGLSQTGTTGDAVELCGEPDVHRLDNRPTALLTCQPAIFGGLTANVRFNRIECRDAPKCFLSQRGLGRDLDLVELSPRVGPAEGELNAGVRGVPDHAAKPRVAIDLEQTAEPFQVSGGVLTLPIFAVNISGRRVTWAAPGPVVNRVAPQPPGLRLSSARIEHRQRRIVGEHFGRGQNGAQHQLYSGVSHQQARPTQSHNVERSSVMP